MENPANPNPIEPSYVPPVTNPATPGESQEVMPNTPDTEINPGKPGNATEVDLDRSNIEKFPQQKPPEEH